jgi:hypothetical protein
MAYNPLLERAHEHSMNHREEILRSEVCGCFYCLEMFTPSEIEEWIDEDDETEVGRTAMCPKCGIDSVIGSGSGFPIQKKFLKEMERYWFQ